MENPQSRQPCVAFLSNVAPAAATGKIFHDPSSGIFLKFASAVPSSDAQSLRREPELAFCGAMYLRYISGSIGVPPRCGVLGSVIAPTIAVRC